MHLPWAVVVLVDMAVEDVTSLCRNLRVLVHDEELQLFDALCLFQRLLKLIATAGYVANLQDVLNAVHGDLDIDI